MSRQPRLRLALVLLGVALLAVEAAAWQHQLFITAGLADGAQGLRR